MNFYATFPRPAALTACSTRSIAPASAFRHFVLMRLAAASFRELATILGKIVKGERIVPGGLIL